MWSFQDQYEYFQSMSQDNDADHLVLGKKNINIGIKKLQTEIGVPPQEEERTFTTTTSASYVLPERFIKLKELYVTIGSYRYYATQVFNDLTWGYYKRQTISGDQMTRVFVRPGLNTFEVYPTPSTAGNTMTMIYESFSKDLSAADYITGTITTLANAGTAVTFNGTTLTAGMAGRWLKPATDNNWYKISAILTTSTATLLMPFQGVSLAAATESFRIGELPRLPEGTHDLPVEYALWKHFTGIKRDEVKAKLHQNNWDDGIKSAKATFSSRYASNVIPSQNHERGHVYKDPNDYPNLSGA